MCCHQSRHPTSKARAFEFAVLVSIFIPAAFTLRARADDATSDKAMLQEVVVTAQRREEDLQTTPVAVTAINADELRARNIVSLADVQRSVPGLSISTAHTTAPTSALPVVYIRGIGQQDPSIFQDPGVGIYVDGVYVARSAGSVIDLPDIQRVEVLRGPQGTLFGRNAVGGAVNVVTELPPDVFRADIELTVGNYSLADVRGIVGGPLADNLTGSAAFGYRHQDGYEDRLVYPTRKKNGTQGGTDHLGARGHLHWTAGDNVTVDFSGDYSRYDDDTSAGITTVYDPPKPLYDLWNNLIGIPSGTPWTPETAETGGRYSTYATGPNYATAEIWGSSGTVTVDLGFGTFKSITAYRDVHETYTRDSDGSAANFFGHVGYHDLGQFSQELQLYGKSSSGRLDWIGGFYVLHETGEQQDDAVIAPGLYTVTGNPALEIGRVYTAKTNDSSYAGFGQATLSLTPNLNLIAGVRYTRDEKASTVSGYGQESGRMYVPPTRVKESWGATTLKFGVQYQFSPDVMGYASATQGFKSGGFNGRAARPDALTIFDPETVWSYEAGLKSEWLERRLRFNTAVYRMDYRDLQLARYALTPQGVLNTIENVAAAKIWGAEVEVTTRPFREFQLTGAAAYNHNQYTNVQPGATVANGQRIPFTPSWTTNFAAQYTFNVGASGTLTPRIEYNYKSRIYTTLNNTLPSLLPGYELINARITYQPVQRPWSLSIYGTNLTNSYYFTAAQDNTAICLLYRLLGRPREFGATFQLSL